MAYGRRESWGWGWGLAGLAEGLAWVLFLMSWVNTEFPYPFRSALGSVFPEKSNASVLSGCRRKSELPVITRGCV